MLEYASTRPFTTFMLNLELEVIFDDRTDDRFGDKAETHWPIVQSPKELSL